MSTFVDEDTIAAIATPSGEGGIAVVRISGPKAFSIADAGFRGRARLGDVHSHTAHFGEFLNQTQAVIDQVVATVFREPHSYTGEDTVELSCHGGTLVSRNLLQAVLQYGARPAEPGEFTRRAFLNGRIDLTQAEAVADLIHARSEQARRSSMEQLEGKLSSRINELREKLLKASGLLELELDFSEEGLEFIDKINIINEITALSAIIAEMIKSYSIGKVYRDGVKVVIVGKPNVGKSSLLNRLLNENRAIVTDVPGTTRDVIEENIVLSGLLFRLVDTAGIRESNDLVEAEGIRRSDQQLRTADLILFLVDPTQGIDSSDRLILEKVKAGNREVPIVFVSTKCDLSSDVPSPEFTADAQTVSISSTTGAGIDTLESLLCNLAVGSRADMDSTAPITNLRHKDKLDHALAALANAKDSLQAGKSNELVAVDLHAALLQLGEIVGVVTSEDVLNTIFEKFCIGK